MVIAHYLGGSDDTMKVLQAVLDTNFWLATHVTTVTLGYTATFVAGMLAMIYLYRMLAGTVLAFFRNRGEVEWSNGLIMTLAVMGVAFIPAVLVIGLFWGLVFVLTGEAPETSGLGGILEAVVLLPALVYAIMIGVRYVSPQPEDRPGEAPGLIRWMEPLELGIGASKDMSNLVYGVVCFAVLLSFVGTVLGGIWADQSWGRFWGWDPKENGAILVVVINALILHARWGGMIRERGLVMLALVGNMVTMWSWFGTNQLGIGLHSYGFNNALIKMCSWFWISQLVLIGLAALPGQYWKAYAAKPEEQKPDTAAAAPAHGIRTKKGKGIRGTQPAT
jgi:ABC-type transport system involved in cytochrome c biogenesis permease subunit